MTWTVTMAEQPGQTEYYVVTGEQLAQLAESAANGAADAVLSDVAGAVTGAHDSLSSQLSGLGTQFGESAAASGTVTLSDEQFSELCELMSGQLHGSIYIFGALMFMVGLYGVTQVVRHWRAG